VVHDLQRVNGQDRPCAGGDADGSAVRWEPERIADLRTVYRKLQQRSTTQERPTQTQVAAPRIVAELVLLPKSDVGSVLTDSHFAGHLVGTAHQRQPIAAVE